MPSATDFLDAPQAPQSASAFLGEEPSPTPTAADAGGEGDGFLAKISAALRKPSPDYLQAPEQAVRELVSGMVPHDLPSYLESIYPPAAAARLGANVAEGDISGLPFVGRVPEIMQAEDTPAGSKERYLTAMKTLMDVGMLAGAGERGPLPAEVPPEAAPVPPQPPPVSPEIPLAPPVTPDWFQAKGTVVPPPVEAPPVPPPPIGTPLKPVPLIGPNGSTPAADMAAQVQQPGPAGFTATMREPWETPPEPPVNAAPVPEPYTPEAAAARAAQPQPATAEAPIGAANRIARAREDAGLTEAPPSGIGIGWHESVAQGNSLIDKGADAYKVVSDFQKTGDISGEKMSVARAWLERLQRTNQEARGALEQNPTNPDLQRSAIDAEAAENAFWQGYQPMKTEWSKIGTGMQEQRGITDTDLLSQKTAEQVMRENIERELTAADKARAAKAVKDTRQANANVDTAFDKAITEASRKAKGPPRSLEQLKNDLAAKLKELTPC